MTGGIHLSTEIINTKDLKKRLTLNSLFYGPPGVGKTTFVSQAPKPVLFIDVDGGCRSITDRDCKLAECKTIAEVRETMTKALKQGFQTLVIDTMTRYSELLMLDILKEDKKISPRFEQWNKLTSKIKEITWFLKEKEINMVFLCHEKELETGQKRPNLPGQLISALPAIVDIVGYLYALGDQRMLSVNLTENWYGKHRGELGSRIKEDMPLSDDPQINSYEILAKQLLSPDKKAKEKESKPVITQPATVNA